jgi:hypothetical protein
MSLKKCFTGNERSSFPSISAQDKMKEAGENELVSGKKLSFHYSASARAALLGYLSCCPNSGFSSWMLSLWRFIPPAKGQAGAYSLVEKPLGITQSLQHSEAVDLSTALQKSVPLHCSPKKFLKAELLELTFQPFSCASHVWKFPSQVSLSLGM